MSLPEEVKELIKSGIVINEDGQVCHSSLQVFTKCWSNRINHIMRDMGYTPVFAGRDQIKAWSGHEVYYLIQVGEDPPITCNTKDLRACKAIATSYARYGCGDIVIRDTCGRLVARRAYYQSSTLGFGWGSWINHEVPND